jgi:predicted  nucleic acid-binding Zn-ribbon protein
VHQREEKQARAQLDALKAKVDKQDAEAMATRAELAAAWAKVEGQQALLDKFDSDVNKLEIKLSVAEQEKKAQEALEQEVWTLQRQLGQLKDVETKLAEEKGARSEMQVEISRLQSCLTLHSDGTQYVRWPPGSISTPVSPGVNW